MKEAANEDYRVYENFSALFIRPLKPGIRPIDDAPLVNFWGRGFKNFIGTNIFKAKGVPKKF